MLGKLIKYELKASSRLFLALYAALIIVALINMGTIYIVDMPSMNQGVFEYITPILTGFFMFVYVILIIATVISTLIAIIVRFYNNLLGDEGYLMFTLPVTVNQHILSKLLSSLVWFACSTLVIFLSINIVVIRFSDYGAVADALSYISGEGLNIPLWILGILFAFLCYAASVILQLYGAMSIGPNLTKNRLLGSFLGYVIIYVAGQIVSLIALFSVMNPMTMNRIDNQFAYISEDPSMANVSTGIEVANTFGIYVLVIVIVINVLVGTGCYLLSRYMLTKKLNLA